MKEAVIVDGIGSADARLWAYQGEKAQKAFDRAHWQDRIYFRESQKEPWRNRTGYVPGEGDVYGQKSISKMFREAIASGRLN